VEPGQVESPVWWRKQVARVLVELRDTTEARIGRKVSVTEAAKALGCSVGKISGMHTGEGRLNFRDVRDLALLYEAPPDDIERLVDWAKRSVQPSGFKELAEVMGEPLAELIGGEAEAHTEIDYEHGLMPGLLQCESYAEAQAEAAGVAPERIPLVVALRKKRQLRLTDDNPLTFEAFVEEQVLHRPIGSTAVMRAQLQHMLTMGELDNVTVRVVRTRVGYHRALGGRFILLGFADFPTAVYLEQPPVIGSRYADDPALAADYAEKIEDLRAQADSPEESAELIKSVMGALPLEG
jgi:hypothetical protein